MFTSPPAFIRKSAIISYILLVFGILLFVSCNKTDVQNDTLSPKAAKALAEVDFLASLGHGKEALAHLDSTYRLFKPNTKDLFEKYKVNSQYYLIKQNDTVKASSYVDSLFTLLRNKEYIYKSEYVSTLFLKGNVSLHEGKKNEAFRYYYDAREFAVKNLDSCSSYTFVNKMGLIRYGVKQYGPAIHDVKQALALSENCQKGALKNKEFMTRQTLFNTIGICFEKLGELDSAILYYNKGLIFIDKYAADYPTEKIYLSSAKGVIFGNMGGVYSQMGNYRKAEEYLTKSIRINDQPRFEQIDAISAKLKIAELYLKFSDYKKAQFWLKDLWHTVYQPKSERKMPIQYRSELYRLQWKYFDLLDNQTEAYRWTKLYYNLRDSINDKVQSYKVPYIDLTFKFKEQQFQLELLDKENALKRAYIAIFAVFMFMGIVSLFIVWRSWRKQKISNAKIVEQNLDMQKALSALEQSQEENTRVMKIIAHDLRNPMAITISITNIMLENEGLQENEKEMLGLMKTSNVNSLEMVTDLLNINTTKEALKKESVKIHSMLKHCVGLLQFKAREKQQTITLHTEPVTLSVSREKIWRVISNLIVNAIKFSPNGANIIVEMQVKAATLLISVQDNGIGIPENLQENIFDIYTVSKRLGTSGEHSFGMGLAISKQIVEAHSGKIWLKSTVGIGSTFFVELPLDLE